MKTPVFYVPSLHRQAAPAQTPPEAAFFPVMPFGDDALPPDAPALAADTLAAEALAASVLPLGRSEARAVLEEMLRRGEEFAVGGRLRQVAAAGAAAGGVPGGVFGEGADLSLRGEMSELADFSSGAEPDGEKSRVRARDWQAEAALGALRAEQMRRALVDCQKVLLLAHFQEEKKLEVAALSRRAHKAESALLAALGEGLREADELPAELLSALPPSFSARAASGDVTEAGATETGATETGPLAGGAPWRAVVDAAMAFLPEGAALLTLDDDMALDMKEAGILQPFPEDRAELVRGWPPELGENLLYAALPAWRLVGRRAAPERPWLDREVEVLAARPLGGWTRERSKDAEAEKA